MADVCGAVVANLQHGWPEGSQSRAQERSNIGAACMFPPDRR
jgi:hypothetical protein